MMANPQMIKQLLQLPIMANEDVCLNHELSVFTEAVGNISSWVAQLSDVVNKMGSDTQERKSGKGADKYPKKNRRKMASTAHLWSVLLTILPWGQAVCSIQQNMPKMW